MLKKWKKTVKLCATTIIVLIYVTIGLFNNGTLKREEEEEKRAFPFAFESAATTERYFRIVRTVIGYSEDFRLGKELEDRIECDAEGYPEEQPDGRDLMWKSEKNLGIRIFSAYYDQRQKPYHYVRIIGLVWRNSSFYCQIWYKNNETTTYITQKAIVREIWSLDWGPKNTSCNTERPAIISCLAPHKTIPSWVSFVDKSCSGGRNFVKITKPTSNLPKKNFVICIKPLNFKHFTRENLFEWVGINSRLGAERFVFYSSNLTEPEQMFRDHRQKERLTWKEFRPPRQTSCTSRNFEESIWHKRKMEIVAYNDCFYNNLYQTKFVIPLDVDEIIVPKTGNNWFEAFRSHFLNAKLSEDEENSWPEDIENYASFSVRNAYFFPEYPKDAIIRSLTLPNGDQNISTKLVNIAKERKGHPVENMFERTLRSFRLSPKSDSVKSFVHVAKTLSVFNHYAFHVLGEATRQLIFPENVFLLNHYRNSCDPVLIDGCREFLNQVVYDNSLEKFRKRTKPLF